MTDLNTLAKHRDELLKAELAALLHNLGKFDVNFLTNVESSSAGLSAWDEIKAKHYEIGNEKEKYQFKRFAAPNGALLSSPPSRSIESYEQEAHELFKKWQSQNGPLYFCRVADRVNANAKLQDINEKIDAIRQKLRNLATPDKSSLRTQLADLQRNKSEAEAARKEAIASIYSGEKKEQSDLEEGFRAITISIGGEQWTIADLITLFWDDFFHKPNGNDYQRVSALAPFLKLTTGLTALLALAHGEVSGGEKPSEGEDGRWGDLCLTTAFGYRESKLYLWEMSDLRREIVDVALTYGSKPPSESRVALLDKVRQHLRHALSDTRWPYNEISLWDYSSSTAALFKAAAAAAVLTGSIPPVADARWRLLAISYHGLDFWGQAHHIPDLLARREAVQQGLDAVRELLEVTYPLGNEIYRDEHGSVFVVPDYDKLLDLKDEHKQSLEQRICTAFNISDATGVAGELQPQLYLSEEPYAGKQIKLAEVLRQRSRTNHVDLEQIEQAWPDKMGPVNAPICTVCGVRPVGYPNTNTAPPEMKLPDWASSDKAEKRNLCCVCLARRGRRAEDWVANENNAFERTIWTDEVADQHGRLALIVGRFELDGWLDGTLIATLQKSASFARIQRCWQTTRTFWHEVEQTTIPQTLRKQKASQPRLQITPANAKDLARNLGHYHAYELDLQGRRLSVCWDPKQKVFWTTDNLAYIGKLLSEPAGNRDKDPLQRLREAITGKDLAIYEPGGYGQARALKSAAKHCTIAEEPCLYAPYIPLVTEPAIFLALVPASHALAVAEAIKAKYDSEMGRVKDRLPLYLGIIFAPRRTPMRALLDAGRMMLKFPFAWEAWRVAQKDPTQPYHVTLTRNGQCLTWHYPATMGDGTTADQWYPYLLTEEPVQGKELTPTDFRHVKDLSAGDTIYIRPSRFDFAFLDTTGRRFALHYNQDGRRSDSHPRPYLLDDLSRFKDRWASLRLLERTQTYQIIQTIEASRALWFGNDADARSLDDPTLRQFVSDTLADAPWPDDKKWWAFDDHEREQLIAAGVRGELADLAELYFEILKQKD